MWWKRRSGQQRPRRRSTAEINIWRLQSLFNNFRRILQLNNSILEDMAHLERTLGGEFIFDRAYLESSVRTIAARVHHVTYNLNALTGNRYVSLYDSYQAIHTILDDILSGSIEALGCPPVLPLSAVGWELEQLVGIDLACLAELRHYPSIQAPRGFVVSVEGTRTLVGGPVAAAVSGESQLSAEEVRAAITEQFRLLQEMRPTDRFSVVVSKIDDGEELVRELARFYLISGANTDLVEIRTRQSSIGPLGIEGERADSAGGEAPRDDVERYRCCLERIIQSISARLPAGPDGRPPRLVAFVRSAPPAAVAGTVETYTGLAGPVDALAITVRRIGAGSESQTLLFRRTYPFELIHSRGEGCGADRQVPGAEADPGELQNGSFPVSGKVFRALAETAVTLERMLGIPVSLRWEWREDDICRITRLVPVRVAAEEAAGPELAGDRLESEIICRSGQMVQSGVAAGKVFHVSDEMLPATFPTGAVAVARVASPQLTPVLHRAAAIVTEYGTATGHLATVARELRLPAIFGVAGARGLLSMGAEVTVDASETTIYNGIHEEMLGHGARGLDLAPADPEYRLLRRLLRFIMPLNLVNPEAPGFTPEGCRTFHDIIHFCHEKAIEELAHFQERRPELGAIRTRRMHLGVPMDIRVLDIGGGLVSETGIEPTRQDTCSAPFSAFLDGLLQPQAWTAVPSTLGIRDIISGMPRSMGMLHGAPELLGENLAIVSHDYMNLSLRLGYHFSVIDTHLSQDGNRNYVYFRFAGGLADPERRGRRAKFLSDVLLAMDFKVSVKGDLVIGNLKLAEPGTLRSVLYILGALTAFSRQRDTGLYSDADTRALFKVFADSFLDRFRQTIPPAYDRQPMGETQEAEDVPVAPAVMEAAGSRAARGRPAGLEWLTGYFRDWKKRREHQALAGLTARYHAFRIFLENNSRALELLVGVDGRLSRGREPEIRKATEKLLSVTGELVDGLNLLSGDAHPGLYALHGEMAREISGRLDHLQTAPIHGGVYCIFLGELEPHSAQLAGTKAANLARLRRMSLPVPDGFVCTTDVCKAFISSGNLAEGIGDILRKVEREEEDVTEAANRIRSMILGTPLPEEIGRAMEEAYRQLEKSHFQATGLGRPLAVSVRSSGVSEDRVEYSFAGQFSSLLNVQGLQALFAAYREVIASGFSARAISYRLNARLSPVDFDLAVLCQVMLEPACAGVLLTRDPSQPENGRMLISAVPGLGTMAVSGSAPVDLYRPPRSEQAEGESRASLPDLMDGAHIPHKTQREVATDSGGLRLETVPENEADLPLLTRAQLAELVRLGEIIERLEGVVQDVEWACTRQGKVKVLQARPLRLPTTSKGKRIRLPSSVAPLLAGNSAAAGKAVGRVRIVRSAAELQQFEMYDGGGKNAAPSILVLPQSIVEAARHLRGCAGVIVDVGNPTDHLSCIAREYGVPMLTGTQTALATLSEGQWVIVDGDHGVVLPAPRSSRPPAGPRKERPAENDGEEVGGLAPTPEKQLHELSPERQALRDMVVPLNLTDAYGATFSRLECRSLHDIIRYTHEMAVLAMFDAGDMVMEDAGQLLRPLDIGIPFSCLVIDVGGGVRRPKRRAIRDRLAIRRPLARDDILSTPLAALCEGLTTPELSWHERPDAEAVSGIFSRTLLDGRGARPAGSFNYALAARDYLNLNARVEFHFALLDAVCGKDSHANYIRFRFKGGGAGYKRSRRRAVFLRQVLQGHGFYTSVVGDLVTASLTGASGEVVYQRLVMLGRLLGFSRFLDSVMTTEETPLLLAKAFLAGRYDARAAAAAEEPASQA